MNIPTNVILLFCETAEGGIIIIFLDQQKAFDRVEWGWVDHVLSKFNFGEKFKEWVQMLFKYAQTCIKTNGFVSKYSIFQGPVDKGLIYIPFVFS
jgi:hypothetical protein